MFTFNFGANSNDEKQVTGNKKEGSEIISRQVFSADLDSSVDWEKYASTVQIEDLEIVIIDSSQVVRHLKDDCKHLSALLTDSDLIPGVYEGGMKVWESTYDLGTLIRKTMPALFENKSVLDLGCGSGILGILALKMGSRCVCFQDYNSEVLSYLTIPSVNLNDARLMERSQFWCGDWRHFETADNTKFDVILSSETIYNSSNHGKLHSVIKSKLKPGGITYIAGKAYYFGVGGSMKGFKEVVEREKVFRVTPIWMSDEGVMREIISLEYRPPN